MSIGNLKDNGNKGNNFPYQLRNLQLLDAINQSIIANGQAIPDLPMAVDAFGRQRVSEAFTLGDYKHIYGINPDFSIVTVGSGFVTSTANTSSVTLSTIALASKAIYQSKIYHPYMPGKSQLIYMTFNMKTSTGVFKKIGYFDDNDGIYFQQDDTGNLAFGIRTSVSGVPIDAELVPQALWNVDTCDGSGPSGFDLNINTTQILFIDFQWLGVGTARLGFVHDGKYVVAHEFNHDNSFTEVYMRNPNLPVRAEVISGPLSGKGSLNFICSTVLSEGGYIESGQDWSALNTSLRTLASGASLPLFAVRLTSTFKGYTNRMFVRLDNFNIFSTKEPLLYELIKLPDSSTLTGGSWVSVNSNSGIEYNQGLTANGTGEVLSSGYVPASASGKEGIAANSNPSSAKKNYITQDYNGTTSEVYLLFVTNLGTTTTTAGASMQWREIF